MYILIIVQQVYFGQPRYKVEGSIVLSGSQADIVAQQVWSGMLYYSTEHYGVLLRILIM